MISLNIFVMELTKVQDVFGSFVTRVRKIAQYTIRLIDQAIMKLQAICEQLLGRAPPKLLVRKEIAVSRG